MIFAFNVKARIRESYDLEDFQIIHSSTFKCLTEQCFTLVHFISDITVMVHGVTYSVKLAVFINKDVLLAVLDLDDEYSMIGEHDSIDLCSSAVELKFNIVKHTILTAEVI